MPNAEASLQDNVPLHHPEQLFIDGKWVSPCRRSTIEVVSPSTENVYVRVAEAGEEDMLRAIAAARKAFDHGPWPQMTHAARARVLRQFASALRERVADTSQMWSSEMGIVHTFAHGTMLTIPGVFDYYAGLADIFPFHEPHAPTAGGEVGWLVREPVGVVGAIIPWNVPIALIAYKIAPALLAGCTVILKSSPEAPTAGYVMGEIAEAVGLPPGVLNIVTADRPVSEFLVRHADVDKITFTGSTAAGRRIASLCGERIARCTLELGGKSAAVILDDYDLAKAAESISGSARLLSGQVCSSLTRIIVSRHRHDALVDALSSSMSRIRVGDPFDARTEMGPLAMSRQRDRVEGLIAKGREEGAELATGGGRPSHLDQGFYIEPTVFGNVKNDSTIAREEIFGPVLSVIPAADEDEAVDLANASIYGLNASVFTDDEDRAYAVARRLRSGTVGRNSWRTDFGIAFGGFKQSGIGREGGHEGLHPFLEVKTIIL